MSSAIGPIGVFTALGGGRAPARSPGSRSGSARPSLTALERQARAAQREEQIRELVALERALTTLHHEQFQAATPTRLPAPREPDRAAALRTHTGQQTQGISWWRRTARREARARAVELTEQQIRSDQARDAAAHQAAQAEVDAEWAALCAHHPDAVLHALEEAYEDNQSPAAAIDVGIEGGERYATVMVVFGALSSIPEQVPALTPTGRPTVRKRTKTDRNTLYAAALGSTVLATVKEAFAVAPSLDEVRIVVLRRDPHAPSPADYVTAIYTGRFHRRRLERTDWGAVDPAEALLAARDARLTRRGSARDIAALDLSEDPSIQTLIDHVRGEL